MIEDPTALFDSPENELKQKKEKIIALAIELSARQEGFPFPGIDSVACTKLKADEERFPGFATPIDTLIERFKNEGMKIVMRADGGDVYILPKESDDIENNSICPKHLQLNESTDKTLKELIILSKG